MLKDVPLMMETSFFMIRKTYSCSFYFSVFREYLLLIQDSFVWRSMRETPVEKRAGKTPQRGRGDGRLSAPRPEATPS